MHWKYQKNCGATDRIFMVKTLNNRLMFLLLIEKILVYLYALKQVPLIISMFTLKLISGHSH